MKCLTSTLHIYNICRPCVYLFKCGSICCLGYQLDQFQASEMFLSLYTCVYASVAGAQSGQCADCLINKYTFNLRASLNIMCPHVWYIRASTITTFFKCVCVRPDETFLPLFISPSLRTVMASHKGGMLTLALTVILLALPSLINGKILYVQPMLTSTTCPTDPCYTLSEYAQDHRLYFNGSNTTLQFLPGEHTLNMNIDISSHQKLEIIGDSTVPTRVVCTSLVGFTFRDISELRIQGLVFVSCASSRESLNPGDDV